MIWLSNVCDVIIECIWCEHIRLLIIEYVDVCGITQYHLPLLYAIAEHNNWDYWMYKLW